MQLFRFISEQKYPASSSTTKDQKFYHDKVCFSFTFFSKSVKKKKKKQESSKLEENTFKNVEKINRRVVMLHVQTQSLGMELIWNSRYGPYWLPSLEQPNLRLIENHWWGLLKIYMCLEPQTA